MIKYEVLISKFAENDLLEIVNYYESKNKKYALDLYSKIKARILELHEFPERGRIVPELERQGITGYRELIESYYRVIYSINRHKINVLVIVDSRRNLDEVLVLKLMEVLRG